MKKSRIDYSAYQKTGNIVLGFHGCDKKVGERIIKSQTEHLTPSKNDYDWLGSGIYFWLNDPIRAYEWAVQSKKVSEPFVVGAIIDLGNCLNLSERVAVRSLRRSYEEVKLSLEIAGKDISEIANKRDDKGGFKLLRPLDCAVINNLVETASAMGTIFDTVYGYFQEGTDAYPGAGIREKSHIQICVRNKECIKGYFLPRSEE